MDKQAVKLAVTTAISEAEKIALSAKADPSKWVVPDINTWREKWVESTFYGSESPGYFDRLTRQAWSEAKHATDSQVILPGFGTYDLEGLGTGEAEDSEAVLKYLGWCRTVFTDLALDAFFADWDLAISKGDGERLRNLYTNGPRFWQIVFQTIYNTMIKKMEQGARPEPVPGPDEILLVTPFGKSIIKKSERTIGSLTVTEFTQLMADILKGY